MLPFLLFVLPNLFQHYLRNSPKKLEILSVFVWSGKSYILVVTSVDYISKLTIIVDSIK